MPRYVANRSKMALAGATPTTTTKQQFMLVVTPNAANR